MAERVLVIEARKEVPVQHPGQASGALVTVDGAGWLRVVAAELEMRGMTETSDRVEIVDNPDERRFEARIDGVVAGGAYYRRRKNRIIFTHTEVDVAHEGRGVGSRIARVALETIKARGERAVPLCPFIRSYIDRHAEFSDLVDEELTRSLLRR